MLDSFGQLFDTSGFPPRWTCGTWTPAHGWTHIVSDVAIFAAYFAIPIVLAVFVLRRRDAPFPPVFWLFGAFILSCGVGHLIESSLFWRPWYRLSAAIKVVTAVVSWGTVITLVATLPRALGLPGLAAVNVRLEEEVRERGRAEAKLREHASELERANQDLEEFTQSIVGREDRLIELKQEVNRLLRELGREPRYALSLDTGLSAER